MRRDASRSKGPLSDTEIGYIVSNALSESAGPAAPASLSTDALAKEIAEYDYSSLRQRIHSMPQAYRVIRSVLKSLHDPYCRFLDPEAFATLGKYDMSGVGLNLGATEGAGFVNDIINIDNLRRMETENIGSSYS